jgi:hypothetical protein
MTRTKHNAATRLALFGIAPRERERDREQRHAFRIAIWALPIFGERDLDREYNAAPPRCYRSPVAWDPCAIFFLASPTLTYGGPS